MDGRDAFFTPNKYQKDLYNLADREEVFVLGFFQLQSIGEDAYPIALIELHDGRVISTDPERIQFADRSGD